MLRARVSLGFAVLFSGAAMPAMAADIVYAPPPPTVVLPDVYDQPQAVSALNGKLEAGYSWLDYEGFPTPLSGEDVRTHNVYGIGSVSAPVTRQFGVQVDAGVLGSIAGRSIDDPFTPNSTVDPRNGAYGIGAHFFWRDPERALLGVYAHFLRFQQDFDVAGPADATIVANNFRVGAAGEYYHNNWTLEGFVGADFVNTTADAGGGGVSDDRSFFAGRALAAYYPNDDTRLFAGVEYAFNEFAGVLGGEYLFNSASPMATAAFVEGSIGESTTTIEAGLRIYFGPDGKPLIDRHREDDPRPSLFDPLSMLASCVGGIWSTSEEFVNTAPGYGYANNASGINTGGENDYAQSDSYDEGTPFDGGNCGTDGTFYRHMGSPG